MKLPSLDALVSAIRATLRRFPMVLLAAVVAAVAGVIATYDAVDEELWGRVVGTAALGMPFFLAVDLLAERRRWSIGPRSALWTLGTAGLVGFYLLWLDWSEPVAVGRYIQLSAGLHLLVSVAPFIGVRELQGFWEYNKSLFLRFLMAGLYSAVLFAGLAIALAAVDNLFGLEVPEETYFRLWIMIAFLFNTWFFLGGVPQDLPALEQRSDYPMGLKVFAQYVLIPIVVVYLLILTTYLGKIIVTTVWPSGWIGWLVSSVAAVGIFSLLLVHPVAERAENRWIRTYARAFYITLLPSVVMLWLATWKRIDQYGITERRYFLAVLSIWLAAIAVYYAIRRSRDIRIIPASLCVVALVTFAGPWGAYRMSEASQVRRLERLLTASEILQSGTIRQASLMPSLDDRREISSILRYLVGTHGTGAISDWFGGALATIDTVGEGTGPSPQREADERAELLAAHLGVGYIGESEARRPGAFSYAAKEGMPVPVAGFDYAWAGQGLLRDSAVIDDGLLLRYDSASVTLRLSAGEALLTEIPLRPIIDSAQAYRAQPGADARIPPAVMRVTIENDRIRLAAYVTTIRGRDTEGELVLSSLGLNLIYAMK
ncbi:MAG: DUF4153 domain-containing protein [Gemmatimonadota bacterium]|nr:DUF4153 domain-containing protein [Gemmatimonadota bacterium]MDH5550046.1 DUF4153 domain-containing protein [Gemmatimonadota bacterium]